MWTGAYAAVLAAPVADGHASLASTYAYAYGASPLKVPNLLQLGLEGSTVEAAARGRRSRRALFAATTAVVASEAEAVATGSPPTFHIGGGAHLYFLEEDYEATGSSPHNQATGQVVDFLSGHPETAVSNCVGCVGSYVHQKKFGVPNRLKISWFQ